MNISEKEIDVMKHCIGIGTKRPYTRHGKKFYRPYRNRYYTYVYDETFNGLVEKGYAKHGNVNEKHQTFFFLTRNGLDALGKNIGVYIYDEEE